MKTYKQIENGVIATIGKSSVIPSNGMEITEEKYDEIMAVIQSRPDDTLDVHYYLSAETETYVGRETTHEEKVDWYVNAVITGTMTIEDVPAEYKAEVQAIIDSQGKDLTSEEILSELESEVGING